jgi:chitin synthase
MLAMTGIITTTTKRHSLITLLQDMEYVHGQLFERAVESACGAVTCLPGALTMLRFSAFRRMAKYYFADKVEQCRDMFDYGKCHLGEDRWLTHLFMVAAKNRYQIQMCTSAFCKTEAVQTFDALLKQRRRWFVGFLTNEVCMLTDVRIWQMYPMLAMVRFLQNTIRTTSLLFVVLVIALISKVESSTSAPLGLLAIVIGLSWSLMIYFGVVLKRWKPLGYPLMFVFNPILGGIYMVYACFTYGQRTWGGPRADAAAADENTTPREAVEKALAGGDDFNVIPESFGPAVEAQHGCNAPSLTLQPPGNVEGRFTVPEKLPGGFFEQINDSGQTVATAVTRPGAPVDRDSCDSFISARTAENSVYLPRRIESLMDEEERLRYAQAQNNQPAAEGPGTGTYSSHEDRMMTLSSVSFESLTIHDGQIARSEATSFRSVDVSSDRGPTWSTEAPLPGLTIPGEAHMRPSRQARSPLGRSSIVRTPSQDNHLEIFHMEMDHIEATTASPTGSRLSSGRKLRKFPPRQ